ncbi:tyrosine-type recombinase/integrase [Desmonostoc muscorum CCALA 125]|nr:tyrosine-type recombinase/integrase [Desmonostoc muscorum CCALA 125]
MEPLHICWSESKQKDLETQLVGFWAKDVWNRTECPLAKDVIWKGNNGKTIGIKEIQFNCKSKSINTEIKYVLWQRLEKQELSPMTLWRQVHIHIRWITEWINQVAPNTTSFMEKSLTQWELSFRSYVASKGKLCTKKRKYIAEGEIRFSPKGDYRISTLRTIYETLQEAYDERSEYEKDIWDMRKLGVKLVKSARDHHLNFTLILQPWLRQATKSYIRYCLAIQAGGTCRNKLKYLNHFSEFINKLAIEIRPEDINRSLIVEYLSDLASLDLSSSYRQGSIGALKEFLELSTREGWVNVTEKTLIYPSDYPKPTEYLPKYIPSYVIEQLNQHLDALPPYIMRMVLILEETGRRISEVCCLPWDCIKQDSQGDWFLIHYQHKMKKQDSIPVSKELAAVIQEQQEFIISQWGQGFPYLFPTPKPWGKGEPMSGSNFNYALKKLAYEKNICDESGDIYQFHSHQFRHTVGTRMINNGVPIHIVQRYLGHTSLEMTLRYAYIHDQTLKAEFAKYQGRMVDITGKIVQTESVIAEMASGSNLDNIDEQWMKQNILAQALPNGLCSLPVVQGACPYGANKCLSCTHFKTDIRYLDKHQEHLERTNKIVEWAQQNQGSKRAKEILKENLPVQENLERIIATLEVNHEA